MNHHDEFVKFIRAMTWMMPNTQDEIIVRLGNAIHDAYHRGVEFGQKNPTAIAVGKRHDIPAVIPSVPRQYNSIARLPKRMVAEIRHLAKSGDPIQAIKLTRNLCPATLLEAKKFVEKLKERR